MTNPLDIAWAAGLFDGEGCVYVARSKHDGMRYGHHYRISCCISLTHLQTLERFRDLFGGGVHENVNHPGRQLWQWVLSGQEPVRAFLNAILPFAMVKREEIELMLDACDNWESGKRVGREPLPFYVFAIREAYYAALREAKVA